ncbi:MAG: RNA polymerase sigma factor [Chthonomonadales bacterium]|nr:RNA polymerase sigma factor [Chthonomonadales bacterium]
MGRDVPGVRRRPSGDFPADPDRPWVERVRSGDQEAFVSLWRKYERGLLRFFYSRVEDRPDAEDLASETLIAAMEAIPRFRGVGRADDGTEIGCTFHTFLMTIARRLLVRWRRRRGVRKEVRFGDLAGSLQGETPIGRGDPWGSGEEDGVDPVNVVLEAETREAVYCALASIDSSAQFKVVLLHYLAGLAHQEIATMLTTRSETVNNRLQDGRRALRGHYQRIGAAVVEI